MENEVIERFKMHDRMEVVSFLKSMWNENPMPCPFYGSSLVFLHKKAKKDNCDWKCTGCGERLKELGLLEEIEVPKNIINTTGYDSAYFSYIGTEGGSD